MQLNLQRGTLNLGLQRTLNFTFRENSIFPDEGRDVDLSKGSSIFHVFDILQFLTREDVDRSL